MGKRSKKNKRSRNRDDQAVSIEKTANRGCLFLFCLVFLIAGLCFLISFFGYPTWRILWSGSWVEAPCKIVSSRVEGHNSSEGSSYEVKIQYRYEYDGQPYESDRYNFMQMASSGRSGKQRVVANYPPGSEATCYVNPNDPSQAVLYRGFSWDMLFALIPLAFVAFGGLGVLGMLGKGKGKQEGSDDSSWRPDQPQRKSKANSPDELAGPGTITLQPDVSPLVNVIVLLFIALFWNGIVSVFLWQVIKSHLEGDPEWFLTVFVTPFVVVGLGLIAGWAHSVLGLFSPRPTLTLGAEELRLGDSLRLEWQIRGRAGSIRRLKITLKGEEQAEYRRGTSTITDEETFLMMPIVDSDRQIEIQSGSTVLQIPSDSMHSFEGEHNEIVWAIEVEGDIARWPDIQLTFPIVVLPRGKSARSKG